VARRSTTSVSSGFLPASSRHWARASTSASGLGSTLLVACTDVLVEGSHFRRDWSSAHDVGRKAVAVNLADVAAMGARPTAVLAGVCVPGDLEVSWLTGLAEGLRDGQPPLEAAWWAGTRSPASRSA
jgi:hydrogenase maturation factor